MNALELSSKQKVVFGLFAFARFVFYAASVLILTAILFFKNLPSHPMIMFQEDARIEVTQNVIVILIFLCSVLLIVFSKSHRPVALLLAGLMGVVFLREQNNWFLEHLGYGVLEICAFAVVITVLVGVYLSRKQLIDALFFAIQSPAFGWLCAGVTVILFAQHLDENTMWEYLLGEDFPHYLKRAGEESIELLGYLLFIVCVFEYVVRIIIHRKLKLGNKSNSSELN